MWQSIVCPICSGSRFRTVSRVQMSPLEVETQLVCCDDCGHYYLNPRLDREREKEFYKARYHEEESEETWNENRQPFFKWALHRLPVLPRGARLLDVGCGKGYFLNLARSAGWEGEGIDISQSAVAHARSKFGFSVFEGELAEAHYPDAHFDGVVLWNVLDQLTEPLEVTREVHRILKPNGFVAFRISNLVFHRAIHRLSWGQFPSLTVFHLHMFTPKTITSFLRREGFTRIHVENSPLDPRAFRGGGHVGEKLEPLLRSALQQSVDVIESISGRSLHLSPSLFILAGRDTP